MTIIYAQTEIDAPDGETFAPEVAEKFVGQAKDGYVVIAAELTTPSCIRLTVSADTDVLPPHEKEILELGLGSWIRIEQDIETAPKPDVLARFETEVERRAYILGHSDGYWKGRSDAGAPLIDDKKIISDNIGN